MADKKSGSHPSDPPAVKKEIEKKQERDPELRRDPEGKEGSEHRRQDAGPNVGEGAGSPEPHTSDGSGNH